jgi:hypothetical protein
MLRRVYLTPIIRSSAHFFTKDSPLVGSHGYGMEQRHIYLWQWKFCYG